MGSPFPIIPPDIPTHCEAKPISVNWINKDLELRYELERITRAIKNVTNNHNATKTLIQLKEKAKYLQTQIKKALENEKERIRKICEEHKECLPYTDEERKRFKIYHNPKSLDHYQEFRDRFNSGSA